jgi:two-component system, OmpR family, response regulator VicR
MTKPHILLVEDDQNLGSVIHDYLQICGYAIDWLEDGELAWEAFRQRKFDLCIVDVMMPKLDGFSLVERIRKENQQIPVLFLTAKSSKEDKLAGFKIGADDYITKPFNIEELVMRVEVFLKRSKNVIPRKEIFEIARFVFDYPNLSLQNGSEQQSLTQKEADVLKMLCTNQGNIVKREEILLPIWGNDDYFAGRSLDVFISKLRKYLRADARVEIQNVHSVGFKLHIR